MRVRTWAGDVARWVNEQAGGLVQGDIYGSSQPGDDTEMLQKVRLAHARGGAAVAPAQKSRSS